MSKGMCQFNREAPNWPKESLALQHLERQIEFGNVGELPLDRLAQRSPLQTAAATRAPIDVFRKWYQY